MTEQERILWYRYLRSYPLRFRRQKILGRYIADFYCAEANLVVELDGSQHFEDAGQKKDEARSAYLARFGITVFRIPNNEIMENLSGVCEAIDIAVQAALKAKSNAEIP